MRLKGSYGVLFSREYTLILQECCKFYVSNAYKLLSCDAFDQEALNCPFLHLVGVLINFETFEDKRE